MDIRYLRGGLASFIVLFVSFGAWAIDEFHEVTPGVYRGAVPTCTELKDLAQQGLRTVINLDNRSSVIRSEKACAAKLGLRWIDASMSAVSAVPEAKVNLAVDALKNTDFRPVFVHCRYGQDRTGMVVGLFRVESQRWSAREAYDEMLEIGFHPYLKFLDDYYRSRTGL
jgi:tyrosine-protein phosphatase SIW14